MFIHTCKGGIYTNTAQLRLFTTLNCRNCKKYVSTKEIMTTGKRPCYIENTLLIGVCYYELQIKKLCSHKVSIKHMKCKDFTRKCKSFVDNDIDKKPINSQIKMSCPEFPDS